MLDVRLKLFIQLLKVKDSFNPNEADAFSRELLDFPQPFDVAS